MGEYVAASSIVKAPQVIRHLGGFCVSARAGVSHPVPLTAASRAVRVNGHLSIMSFQAR